ncbi:MAG TPA: type I methionyl aminopeptidase [Miltoncostaeaceae bacterium]|nr:type I methionyl aminopeptidase [Miltoncostaeaceae bacterium]
MSIDGPEDLAGLTRAARAVARARDAMAAAVRPGVTTSELDRIGEAALRAAGARSGPRHAYDFPGATCVSVNDELAHGIPSGRVLREGDLVNVDVSCELDGYWADTGGSVPVGRVDPRAQALLVATRAALDAAIARVRPGRPVAALGAAVEACARRAGFSVVASLCGHGVGRFIHEPPSVPNTARGGDGERLEEGMVITVEPFLTMGGPRVVQDADGWTLRTADGAVGAQFEHTLVVGAGGALVLTA